MVKLNIYNISLNYFNIKKAKVSLIQQAEKYGF